MEDIIEEGSVCSMQLHKILNPHGNPAERSHGGNFWALNISSIPASCYIKGHRQFVVDDKNKCVPVYSWVSFNDEPLFSSMDPVSFRYPGNDFSSNDS
jgi:hypothetical protein